MSNSDKKAIIILSIIRTIAEVTGVAGENQQVTVNKINRVLDVYSGTLNSTELKKIEFLLSEIFKELIKQKFIINSDVLFSSIIFFSEKILSFVKNEEKVNCWKELVEFSESNLSYFDDKGKEHVEMIEKTDELVDWIDKILKENNDDKYYKHHKRIKI